MELIGKGGFALVFLAEDMTSKRRSAVKQLRLTGEAATLAEIAFYSRVKQEPRESDTIIQLLKSEVVNPHLYLQFQLGGATLAKSLFQMKGQFLKGERLYRIVYSELYRQLVHDDNLSLMKDLVARMATGL